MKADIIVDLQYGDSGKGKVAHHLLKDGDYTHCIRYNGGCNAGHTIYHQGKKFVTHHIPAGVFFGVKSIIGPGCVVNLEQFFKELKELEEGGIEVSDTVFIASNAHIITDEHLAEDNYDTTIGTTKRGNGPAYRDKYGRRGLRAEDVPELAPYVVDMYRELHLTDNPVILCEGAQGFGLDIDWGDYPYVTSSHCTTAGALLNGIPPTAVRRVWGVAKAYETYVGAKKFQPKSQTFSLLQKIGNEYGATTGRPRQCNWMNVSLLRQAIDINGVTDLVINKVDVLQEIDEWAVRFKDDNSLMVRFQDEEQWKEYILTSFPDLEIYFSESPEEI